MPYFGELFPVNLKFYCEYTQQQLLIRMNNTTMSLMFQSVKSLCLSKTEYIIILYASVSSVHEFSKYHFILTIKLEEASRLNDSANKISFAISLHFSYSICIYMLNIYKMYSTEFQLVKMFYVEIFSVD